MAIGSYSFHTEHITALGALAVGRFVTRDATGSGTYPAAGAAMFGVTRYPTLASGENVTVDCQGTAQVESGGVVTAGGAVGSDATGRAVDYASGVKVGRALTGAAGAGTLCEIELIVGV